MAEATDDWGTPERPSAAERMEGEALIVDVDGFEGPLDLLLTLSRTQKVDLRRISVLHLAEQYLEFVRRAAALRIAAACSRMAGSIASSAPTDPHVNPVLPDPGRLPRPPRRSRLDRFRSHPIWRPSSRAW